VLELLSAGASRRHAAAMAGLSASTLTRWLQRGAKARPGSRYGEFYAAAVAAEGRPSLRAISDEWERTIADPMLALRWLEGRGEFNEPPEPPTPTVIRLTLDPDEGS
jgi:hypothetical protein